MSLDLSLALCFSKISCKTFHCGINLVLLYRGFLSQFCFAGFCHITLQSANDVYTSVVLAGCFASFFKNRSNVGQIPIFFQHIFVINFICKKYMSHIRTLLYLHLITSCSAFPIDSPLLAVGCTSDFILFWGYLWFSWVWNHYSAHAPLFHISILSFYLSFLTALVHSTYVILSFTLLVFSPYW